MIFIHYSMVDTNLKRQSGNNNKRKTRTTQINVHTDYCLYLIWVGDTCTEICFIHLISNFAVCCLLSAWQIKVKELKSNQIKSNLISRTTKMVTNTAQYV